MKILALETSAKAVSAAVSENGRILASGYQDTGLTHSRTLMPIVEHILKNTDLKLSDMDAIAVAVGPGSFTGIRIGVSAANIVELTLDSIQRYMNGEEIDREQNIELAVIDASDIADYMKYVQ